MQDFQSIPGLADLIFGGGAANADSGGGKADLRRLRGYPGPGMAPAQQPPVKCPRCDSTNTKFCYYNNYNLSQPRYFCKSCRRYWTKGGVLRNVPVGGGCRKSKRSFSSSSSKSSIKSSANKDNHRRPSSASQSSSDSYGLNANTAAVADGTTSSTPFPNPATLPLTSQTSNSTPNPPVDPIAVVNTAPLYPTPDIFPEPASAGSFRGLMETAKTTPAILGFDFSNTSSLRIPAPRQSAPAAGEEVRGVVQQGFMDPTVAMDLRAPIRGGDESIGLAATATVDWSGSMDTRIFDFAGAVDPATVYWCQSHLADTDPSLYLA